MTPPFHFVSVPGTPYVFLRGDVNMAKHALEKGSIMIEQELAALPEVQALGPNDFVLDVGAFIGDTALIFAKNGAEVLGYEPQRDAWEAARHNTKELDNITILNLPVGNGEGVRLNQDSLNGNLGTRTVRIDKDAPCSIKLDDWVAANRVTFIKIDVEGFEPAVIRGALKLLARDKPTLLVEVYPDMLKRQGYTKEDIYGPLSALGYTIKEVIGNSSEPRWDVLCKFPENSSCITEPTS